MEQPSLCNYVMINMTFQFGQLHRIWQYRVTVVIVITNIVIRKTIKAKISHAIKSCIKDT